MQEQPHSSVPAPSARPPTANGEAPDIIVVKQMHRHDRPASQPEEDASTPGSQPESQVEVLSSCHRLSHCCHKENLAPALMPTDQGHSWGRLARACCLLKHDPPTMTQRLAIQARLVQQLVTAKLVCVSVPPCRGMALRVVLRCAG